MRDTTDFLKQIPTAVPENTLLISFDVESRYSNICHTLGTEAVTYWIDQFHNEIPQRLSKEFIVGSLTVILENNNFQSNNDFFRQIKGTAMGTKLVPTYATLTIGYLEQTLNQRVTETFGSDFSVEFKSLWKRFLDDCFILWTTSKEDPNTLHNTLNNLQDFIKFTMDFNEERLPFWTV